MNKEQKVIIVVDDNDANLTACKKILKPYYLVYPAPSAAKMFDLLDHITPDLILLDVEMPDMDGYAAARMMKSTEEHRKIPIIFLTARNDAISEMEGLNLGALDYIHKPFVSALLLRRIEMHLSLIELRAKETSHAKGEFIAKIKQEMQAPLNTIMDVLNTALGAGDSAKIKNYLDTAIKASKQLLSLVNDTADM